MPTVLDYLKIPLRLKGAGNSLKPAIEEDGAGPESKPVFFLTYAEPTLLPPQWISWVWTWVETKKTPSELGFVQGSLKVVSDGDGKPLRVYQLKDDFLTEHLAQVDPSTANTYRNRIGSWFKETNRGLKAEGHLTPQDIEMLKSLGYVDP